MIIIIRQMMKRRPREVRLLSKGHIDGVIVNVGKLIHLASELVLLREKGRG